MKRILLLAVALQAPVALQSQQVRQVSLADALKLAERGSEDVQIAQASVQRSRGQQRIALSQFLPQLNGQFSYARTLASQFEGFSFGGGPDTASIRALCAPNIEPGATAAERQAAIDAAKSCTPLSQAGGGGGGADFSSVGFGAKNAWTFGLQFSQPLFTGGAATGQRTAANAGRRASDIELTAQRAQLMLDVTQAYYNTVLAARLAEVADAALAMSNDVLRQTTSARQVGSSSEFDLLRAQVARDNQVPIVLQRQNDRAVAMLRLKQMLEIPLDDSLQLTTSIDEPDTAAIAAAGPARALQLQAVDERAVVRQAIANVEAQRGLLRAARGGRLPTFSITSGYQRLFFPQDFAPDFGDFRENWTVGLSANVSLLSGGRTSGNIMMASANLREAEARLRQARELAALDSRIALSQLAQAEASWLASRGTAEQARRAYSIDQIRYKEGISTQTELSNSQLLLEQAMVNRAVAARDLAVARMRMALLPDLPFGSLGASGASMQQGGGATTAPAPQPPRTSGATAPTSGSSNQ
jgi:outer membrane protein TolC